VEQRRSGWRARLAPSEVPIGPEYDEVPSQLDGTGGQMPRKRIKKGFERDAYYAGARVRST